MTQLSIKELIRLNHMGLIPGPGEDEQTFSKRVELSLPSEKTTPSFLQGAQTITENLFDIAPSWISVNFSNDKLPPWHGACAHIFQRSESAPREALLQLRETFKKKERLWHLYSRDEVVTHEMAHIGRMAFDEPQFEEFLAYQTSGTFRRVFGPIVQSAKEAALFMLTLIVAIVGDIASLLVDLPVLGWMKALPLSLVFLALTRLFYRHRQLTLAKKTIAQVAGDRASLILYRLTDEDIRHFSKETPEAFLKEAKEKAQSSLRWKVIYSAYLQE